MRDLVLVQKSYGLQHLLDNPGCFRFAVTLFNREAFEKLTTASVLHDQVKVHCIFPNLIELYDVWVI
jgi:hypothetical protein